MVTAATAVLLSGFMVPGYLINKNEHAQAQGVRPVGTVKKVSLGDLADKKQDLLRAGDPNRRAVAIFYDSKVGTH